MRNRIEHLDNFFNQYEAGFNKGLENSDADVEETANAFADCFIEASPNGLICGKNDAQFRDMIPQGYAFYKSIGVTSMDILSKQVTMLDDYHFMTRIHWRTSFIRKDHSRGSIEFDVIYFTQSLHDEHKIFSYITGDEQKALKENGLI